jgi:hypothetical protein
MNLRKTDLEVATNADGKARVGGKFDVTVAALAVAAGGGRGRCCRSRNCGLVSVTVSGGERGFCSEYRQKLRETVNFLGSLRVA